jgi:hypothetical protein
MVYLELDHTTAQNDNMWTKRSYFPRQPPKQNPERRTILESRDYLPLKIPRDHRELQL